MNIDSSIHRMAFRETESLGVAQVLVARKRADLELKLLRQNVMQSARSNSSNIDSALRDMRDHSEDLVRSPSPAVDKLA